MSGKHIITIFTPKRHTRALVHALFSFPATPQTSTGVHSSKVSAYEEHNIDILRKNRVFTRFFAPFWHFGSVTKKSRNADIFRILVGRELMSSDF